MENALDIALPGAPVLQDWKRLGEVLALYWPDGIYYDPTTPAGIPLKFAGLRLHYLPLSFLVIKDESSAYAVEHGNECSCLIQFKIHMTEGIIAVVEAETEGDDIAQAVLEWLHNERV